MAWLSSNFKYWQTARISLKSRFAYRAEWAGPALTYGLFVWLFSLVWAVAYQGRTDIAGYSRADVTWYFMLAELVTFLANGFFFGLTEEVKTGQIAYTLGRPYSFIAFQFAQSVGPALAQLPVLLPVGYLLATVAVGPWVPVAIGQVAAVLLSMALTLALHFYLQLSLAMTAFWVEETSAFYWLYQKIYLVTGTLMPLEFLPDGARDALLWTPFPGLSWAPAKLFVHFNQVNVWAILGWQVLWVIVAAGLCSLIYRLGVRRTQVQGG